MKTLCNWPPGYPGLISEDHTPAAMLFDMMKGQAYVARHLHYSRDELDHMPNRELRSWISVTSNIIKMEMGKDADDNYDNKPREFWDNDPEYKVNPKALNQWKT